MKITHLRHFVAGVEELHFVRAATTLRISRVRLDSSIQILEAQIGTELFDRRSQNIGFDPHCHYLDNAFLCLLCAGNRNRGRQRDTKLTACEHCCCRRDSDTSPGSIGRTVAHKSQQHVGKYPLPWRCRCRPDIHRRTMSQCCQSQCDRLESPGPGMYPWIN